MNRLRSYRRIEGVSQVDLAADLGISPQLVSKIENGWLPLNFDLQQIGYSSSRLEVDEMTEPLHRQRASTPVASRNRAKELLRLAGEAFTSLSSGMKHHLEPLGPARSDDEIADFACEVRTWVLKQEEHAPIKNLTKAVEQAGVCLVPLAGMEGIDGLSSWVGGQPVIGLNVNVPGDRFRLTLAHELGHLVLHTPSRAQAEPEANRFAAALLIPDEEFDDGIEAMGDRLTIRNFLAMKSVWGVSASALIYRAFHSGYLTDRSYRSLQIQMSKWRKNEPASFDIAPGTLLPNLVQDQGGVHRCGELLGLNPDHLSMVLNWRRFRVV